jgi:signal transduction histidine kinase
VEVELFFDNLEKHVRPFPWGEDVSISIDPDVKRLALALNEIRFMRALINILDNAWRANRTSGAREIVILVRRNAEFLEIEVLDDGPGYIGQGISYQKSGWGSTGLGLAFARRVVSAHGGTLLLARRSDKGNGTSVLISLPAKIP